jgi:hypothetical protein
MRLFEVRSGKLMVLRLSARWFAITAVLCFGFIQSASGEAAKAADSISPDCSAFRKDSDGTWIATKHSEITGSVSGLEPIYPGLNLDMMRPNGLNLVDTLSQKCKTAKPPS